VWRPLSGKGAKPDHPTYGLIIKTQVLSDRKTFKLYTGPRWGLVFSHDLIFTSNTRLGTLMKQAMPYPMTDHKRGGEQTNHITSASKTHLLSYFAMHQGHLPYKNVIWIGKETLSKIRKYGFG